MKLRAPEVQIEVLECLPHMEFFFGPEVQDAGAVDCLKGEEGIYNRLILHSHLIYKLNSQMSFGYQLTIILVRS